MKLLLSIALMLLAVGCRNTKVQQYELIDSARYLNNDSVVFYYRGGVQRVLPYYKAVKYLRNGIVYYLNKNYK